MKTPSGKIKFNFYINEDTYEKVKVASEKLGVSVSGYINLCIHDRMKQDSVMDMAAMFRALEEKFGTENQIK